MSALLGARGGSVRARHLGVVWTAGLLGSFPIVWEFPVRILLPLPLGRWGRPSEGGGVPLRLGVGLGWLLLLLRALCGRWLLLLRRRWRLLPGNLSLLLLLLCIPLSGPRWGWGFSLPG